MSKAPRAALERRIRKHMREAICVGPLCDVEKRMIKHSEELAGYILRLCMMYFYIGIASVVIGQLIYRVVL